jgi:D-beta-D-heptose 7-phosphate kinase/D-beta-D-heptose 1-phosphate adenosyltransferase
MIREILDRFDLQRVMVIGDVMLDHYVWGRVERISPEAPVPVIEVQSEEYRLGGAANVALNVRSLGAEAVLVGIVGNDQAAQTIREHLSGAGISPQHLLTAQNRPTTLKTRIGAVNQQIVRIDYEDKSEIAAELEAEVIELVSSGLAGCSALIIEDYNKGLLSLGIIRHAVAEARKAGIPVAVDPKQRHFFDYRDVDIFKPNYKEMQSNLGQSFDSEDQFVSAAHSLRERMGVRHLVITRGAGGMNVFSGQDRPLQLPTYARDVYDVSGAGDTVISALTLAYASGAEIRTAAEIANHAAGVVCGIKGTACVSRGQVLGSYHDQG